MSKQRDITTSEGYRAAFWERVQENAASNHPMRDAHISLESELRAEYGVQRYSSYRSFSVVKGRGRDGNPRFRRVR